MKIEARHVRRKQLAQYIDINHLKRERKVSESLNSSASVTQLAKKRLSAEMVASKRSKLHESVSFKSHETYQKNNFKSSFMCGVVPELRGTLAPYLKY